MNALLSLFVRPSRQPLRAIVATRSESKAVARKREETTQALRRVVAEQRLVNAVIEQQVHEAMAKALDLTPEA